MAEEERVTVTAERRVLARDPEIHGFVLTIEDGQGLWEDGYGSEAEAAAWLRGAEAMARTLGRHGIRIPQPPPRFAAKDPHG